MSGVTERAVRIATALLGRPVGGVFVSELLRREINEAVLEEREGCAKLCEERADIAESCVPSAMVPAAMAARMVAFQEAADGIRARGDA